MSGFQKQVNLVQAPGVEGDFASMNPFSSMLAGPGALVAPVGGARVGNFVFVNPADLSVHQAYTSGYQIGFVGRNEQALITNFLGESTLVVPQGFMLNAFSGGDFWARFAGGITAGGTVYANETTGAPGSAATNTATATAGFTGDLTTTSGSNVITVTTVTTGILAPGDVVSATGIPAGAYVLPYGTAETTGTGGLGTYALSANATATEAAEAVTTTSAYIDVTALLTGGLSIGDTITGTGVAANTVITSLPPQSGAGLGLYGVSPAAQSFASTTVTGSASIATQFKAATTAAAGALAKISASVS